MSSEQFQLDETRRKEEIVALEKEFNVKRLELQSKHNDERQIFIKTCMCLSYDDTPCTGGMPRIHDPNHQKILEYCQAQVTNYSAYTTQMSPVNCPKCNVLISYTYPTNCPSLRYGFETCTQCNMKITWTNPPFAIDRSFMPKSPAVVITEFTTLGDTN